MFFRQLLAKEATLSYLFGCASCHVAVVVDPVLGDEDWFLAEAAKQDVKITHVIDTHVHADHYSGSGGCAPRWYCRYDSRRVKNRNRKVLQRWLRCPDHDPVFQDTHLHNASRSYW